MASGREGLSGMKIIPDRSVTPVLVLSLVVGWLICPGPAAAAPPPRPAQQGWSGKVTAVPEAAALEVSHDGRSESLRLAGVAPPEKNQPWGRQAQEFVETAALGQCVTVEPQGQDHKQRHLAHIILPDGRDLGAEMIKDGLAWHYRRWSKNPLLGDLEKDARDEKRGLWSDPDPVAPWDWRSPSSGNSPSKRKRHQTRAASRPLIPPSAP